MASSSSASSIISIKSETSQEATPKFDPIAVYEACAPLHWDAEEWDFRAWSKDDESLTDGEDLQLLLGGELDEDDDDDDMSWEGDFSSSEARIDGTSTEEDLAAGGFLHGGSSGDKKETGGGISHSSDSRGDDGSGGDGSDDDNDTSVAPPIKRHKVSGTYWW
jgi:hypothetical protein